MNIHLKRARVCRLLPEDLGYLRVGDWRKLKTLDFPILLALLMLQLANY
jgi:hypothetical protein